MARDSGRRRNAHAFDSQAGDVVELPSGAAKPAVRGPRVRAQRSPADGAAVPPPSTGLRRERAVAHEVEARLSTVIAPGRGARHPVDLVHGSSVRGARPVVSVTTAELKVTDQQRPAQAPALEALAVHRTSGVHRPHTASRRGREVNGYDSCGVWHVDILRFAHCTIRHAGPQSGSPDDRRISARESGARYLFADFSPCRNRLPRPWRGDGRAAPPTAPWSSTATASLSAAGARRGAPPARRPGCRPASSTIAAAPPPAT